MEQKTAEYQYGVLIDILSEMVTIYLSKSKGKNYDNEKKGEDKNAN